MVSWEFLSCSVHRAFDSTTCHDLGQRMKDLSSLLKWNFLVKTVQFLQKSVIDKTKIHKSSLQFNHDKPDFNASSADMGFPVNIISIANDFPTALGRRCVPPAPVQNCA